MIDYISDIRAIVDDCGVTIQVGSGEIRAVYDNPYAALTDDYGIVGGSQRILYCVSGDVTSLKIGSSVTIDGKTYKVISIEPDGTGLTTIKVGER